MAEEIVDLTPIISEYEEFFSAIYKRQINELASRYPTDRSLEVDYGDLSRFNPELADAMLKAPDTYIKAAEGAIAGMNIEIPGSTFAPHVRFFNLPGIDQMIQNLTSSQIDQLIAVKGVVTKRAEVRHRVKVAVFVCSLCNARFEVELDAKNPVMPVTCSSCKRQTLSMVQEESQFIDLQRAEVQELLERLKGGAPTARLEIVMEDDLVNSIVPGDNIEISGVMRITMPPKIKGKNQSAVQAYTRYIEVNHIKVIKRDFEDVTYTEDEEKQFVDLSKNINLYRILVKSLAPDIYGHEEIKEALLLQLFGGTRNKVTKSGSIIRNDMHILLIGDPGAAKTRFLQNVVDIAPKSNFVSGKSVTGAGLTAAAEKDELGDGGWTLKAGALVLASGGIVGVDEFDKISETEVAAMHEVMESQTVSIAKAGIVAKFKAKTAILAAANPKLGRFNDRQLPGEQFDIAPTILSRFDLIFPVFDRMDEEKDSHLAEHILKMHRKASESVSSTNIPKSRAKAQEKDEEAPDPEIIDREFIRKYIAYARQKVYPVLTEDAAAKIKDFYVRLRSQSKGGAVPITARQIEGLIRLAEASAKARLAPSVEIEDAERAIKLVNYVLTTVYTDKSTGQIDIDTVTTGIPKSARDRYQTIMGIIRELQSQYDTVEIAKVIEQASQYNVSKYDVERMIDDLINKGELYKKEKGHVKLVNP